MWHADTVNTFMSRLGYQFKNVVLLESALTHRSFVHENPQSKLDNERLEFLGDTVLQLLVTETLYLRHPTINEGTLSKLRSSIVNEEVLADLAQRLGIPQLIRLGKGEATQMRDSLLADAMEAVLGAVYLEAGLEQARIVWQFCEKGLERDIYDLQNLLEFDAKSRLQEACLARWKRLPAYEGIENKRTGLFQVTLKVEGIDLLCVALPSKKKAELYLAQQCLKYNLLENI